MSDIAASVLRGEGVTYLLKEHHWQRDERIITCYYHYYMCGCELTKARKWKLDDGEQQNIQPPPSFPDKHQFIWSSEAATNTVNWFHQHVKYEKVMGLT